jgi:DNA polymerase III alpha subunit
MKINEYGAVFLTPEELFESIYSNKIKTFKNVYLDPGVVDQFNAARDLNKDPFEPLAVWKQPEESTEFFDEANHCEWFMPDDYFPNLVEFLYASCETDEQRKRVDQELELFIQHGMFDLLFYLKYLVDTMRSNNIVWGVGRGSSVASYVLYLIGVHKIDSIKYELDIHEFLKEK